jgi:hypothetical protein
VDVSEWSEEHDAAERLVAGQAQLLHSCRTRRVRRFGGNSPSHRRLGKLHSGPTSQAMGWVRLAAHWRLICWPPGLFGTWSLRPRRREGPELQWVEHAVGGDSPVVSCGPRGNEVWRRAMGARSRCWGEQGEGVSDIGIMTTNGITAGHSLQ